MINLNNVLRAIILTDKPTPPMGPLEIVEAGASSIEFKWRPPKDSGGCKIQNYILERQQIGRNTWKKVGPIGPNANYKDSDVDHGRRYCYRIRVETEMGISELMETEDIQAGTKGNLSSYRSIYFGILKILVSFKVQNHGRVVFERIHSGGVYFPEPSKKVSVYSTLLYCSQQILAGMRQISGILFLN